MRVKGQGSITEFKQGVLRKLTHQVGMLAPPEHLQSRLRHVPICEVGHVVEFSPPLAHDLKVVRIDQQDVDHSIHN